MRVIDIDGHVREADDLWQRYLEEPFRARAPKIEKVANGQLLFLLEGKRHHRRPDESPFRVKEDGSPVNEHRELATDLDRYKRQLSYYCRALEAATGKSARGVLLRV